MAKIKGWEKTVNLKDLIVYRNKNYTGVMIHMYKPQKYGYQVKVAEKDNYPVINKNFKTKQQALDYAIRYMKSHPNG